MQVTVVRLDRDEVFVKTLELPEGTTLQQAVQEAGWTVGNNQKLALWNVLKDPQTKFQKAIGSRFCPL